jgi:hypothetical protein
MPTHLTPMGRRKALPDLGQPRTSIQAARDIHAPLRLSEQATWRSRSALVTDTGERDGRETGHWLMPIRSGAASPVASFVQVRPEDAMHLEPRAIDPPAGNTGDVPLKRCG